MLLISTGNSGVARLSVSMPSSQTIATSTILKAGLTAEDPEVRENAERARKNLLRLGRFDYLDVE